MVEVTKDSNPSETDARQAPSAVPWKEPRPEPVDVKARRLHAQYLELMKDADPPKTTDQG